MASLASVALIAAGTLGAWMFRDARPGAAAAPVAEAPPLEPGTMLSQRIVNLPNPRALREALIANGVPPAETAAGDARGAFGPGRALGRDPRCDVAGAAGQDGAAGQARSLVHRQRGRRGDGGRDGQFTARAVAPSLDTRIVDVRGEMNDTDF